MAAGGIRERKAKLASGTRVGEAKRTPHKNPPLAAAGGQGLREEYIRTVDADRVRAVKTLELEAEWEEQLADLQGHPAPASSQG